MKRGPIPINADGTIFVVMRHEIRGHRGRTAEVFTQHAQGMARIILEILAKKWNVIVRALHTFFIQDMRIGQVSHKRSFTDRLTGSFHETRLLFSCESLRRGLTDRWICP